MTIDHFDNRKNINNNISIEQLVFGTLVKYQKYLDPRTMKTCNIETILEYIIGARKKISYFPDELYALKFTPWKKRQIKRYISFNNYKKIIFKNKFKPYMRNLIVWGNSFEKSNTTQRINKVISVEDGFVRSVGLGGNLINPLSLLFDKKGIHYDGSKPSDLENLLQTKIFKNELIGKKI